MSDESERPTLLAGEVQWHSSEEDGGPDVGILLGLGDGVELWLGELLEREGGGVGFVLYGGKDRVVAPLDDLDAVREVIECHVAHALRRKLAA